MGVGIAFPNNHYRLVASDVYDAPESVRVRMEKMIGRLNNIASNSSKAKAKYKYDKLDKKVVRAMHKIVESHGRAEHREYHNSLLSVLLRPLIKGVDSGKELLISTYHMPCRFTEPYYMICQAHAMLARNSELLRI